jgi:hypothetical protein
LPSRAFDPFVPDAVMRIPAVLAADRFAFKTLRLEELLLARAENKFIAAVPLLLHHETLRFPHFHLLHYVEQKIIFL